MTVTFLCGIMHTLSLTTTRTREEEEAAAEEQPCSRTVRLKVATSEAAA